MTGRPRAVGAGPPTDDALDPDSVADVVAKAAPNPLRTPMGWSDCVIAVYGVTP